MAQRKKRSEKYPGFFAEASKVMSPDSVTRAEEKARLAVLNHALAKLREEQGIKQTEVKGFSQPGISKIEGGDDMKISTVIEYLHGIGFGLEINAVPLESSGKKKNLLKAS